MPTKDVLIKARDLLENQGWCQGSTARNPQGEIRSIRDPDACSFCLIGALLYSGADCPEGYGAITYVKCILLEEYKNGLVAFNDEPGRKKEEVLALLDKAITSLS